jgi:cardiolipin synthase
MIGLRGAIVAGMALAALAGCATLPHYVLRPSGATPRITGASGPLSPAQSKAVVARLAGAAGDEGMLARHLAIEEAVAETPLVTGNRTRILRDGPETFRAMFAAIRAATDHVHLEYFILEDVESDGERLSDLLLAKRRQGVPVAIIYDSIGAGGTPDAFFDRLAQAGVQLLSFNPVNPFAARAGYSINQRDHRKILLVDGRLAIIGGINLSTTYQSRPSAKPPPGENDDPWHDTDLLIEGPAVGQLQQLFLDQWARQEGPPLAPANFFPAPEASGGETVRIIGSTPEDGIPRYYVTLLSAIRNAERSIDVTAAYFVPTRQEKHDLIAAARRGVRVRLLLPGVSDSQRALDVAHSHYEDLMEAGVEIHEAHGLVLHSKTVTIDGVWSVIGSSNLDHRSVLFNDEVDAVVLGRGTAGALLRLFEADLARAKRIDPKAWARRPFDERVREFLSRAVEALL